MVKVKLHNINDIEIIYDNEFIKIKNKYSHINILQPTKFKIGEKSIRLYNEKEKDIEIIYEVVSSK